MRFGDDGTVVAIRGLGEKVFNFGKVLDNKIRSQVDMIKSYLVWLLNLWTRKL